MNVVYIKLAELRLDGGTQVREGLKASYVSELAALYSDGCTIPPVVVMRDADGTTWLVDGFHRVEARRKKHLVEVEADVRVGSVDDARLLAASLNKNGLDRTPATKRAAVLMAAEAAKTLGRSMSEREIAAHCGVSKSWVHDVFACPCPVPGTDITSAKGRAASPSDQARRERILEAVQEIPQPTDQEIATRVGCARSTVFKVRNAAGVAAVPKSATARAATMGAAQRATDDGQVATSDVEIVEIQAAATHVDLVVVSAPPLAVVAAAPPHPSFPLKPPPKVDHEIKDLLARLGQLGATRRLALFSAARRQFPNEAIEPIDDDKTLTLGRRVRDLVRQGLDAQLENVDAPTAMRITATIGTDTAIFLDDLKRAVAAARRAAFSVVEHRDAIGRLALAEACGELEIDMPAKGKLVDIERARANRKQLARQFHPDVNTGDPEGATARFNAVMQAFRVVESYNEEIANAQQRQRFNGSAHA